MNISIKIPDVNIQENYNDDLPIDELNKFICQEDPGIGFLYGIPGSGKSFLIRHLIASNRDIQFVLIQPSALYCMSDASLFNVLKNYKDSVIIMEDSEEIIKHQKERTQSLTTLLNLADGLLGDCLRLKFICTFNTDLKNIDPALLRRGRTYIKYEFKNLTPDKTYALGCKLGKNISKGISLPLCDIYNYEDKNYAQSKKKVGF